MEGSFQIPAAKYEALYRFIPFYGYTGCLLSVSDVLSCGFAALPPNGSAGVNDTDAASVVGSVRGFGLGHLFTAKTSLIKQKNMKRL